MNDRINAPGFWNHGMTQAKADRELAHYMAEQIELSGRHCLRDGIPEKAERMFAWARKLREEAARIPAGDYWEGL